MKKILIFITVVAVLAVIWFFASRKTQPTQPTAPTPTPTPYIGVSFRGLDMSRVTPFTISAALGTPIRKDEGVVEGQTTSSYASNQGERVINVTTDTSGQVVLIVDPVNPETTKLSRDQAALGKENVILYGHFYELGYNLYVYLTKGVALLGDPKTDQVRERWFFPPTNLSSFLVEAVGFSTTPPDINQE